MRLSLIATFVASAVCASGCSTPNYATPVGRTLSEREASAFEQALRAKPGLVVSQPDPLFVQPANKTEPCKLSTTKDQLERSNFRAFWDGQCKNGFAFGLGRDIAISDTHHVEQITVHDGTGTDRGPSATYDFVNNRAAYRVPTGKFPAATMFSEQVVDSPSGFFITETIGAVDESGASVALQTSPLAVQRMIFNQTGNVLYRFTDNSAFPGNDAWVVKFSAEMVDPATGAVGGVAVVHYGSGHIRHVKLGGPTPESVVLPPDYAAAFLQKANAVYAALPIAKANLERARQMEREYLYLACNGKHTIDGLDATEATRICTWRAQFEPRLNSARVAFNQKLDQLRKNVQLATEQRYAQQQAQQQYNQQQLQAFAGALADMGQQMRAAGQQSLNAVTPAMAAPTVAPFGAKSSNTVLCMQSGNFVTCRD
jgi:hypothetical protein